MTTPQKNPGQDLLDLALVSAINQAGNSIEAVKKALKNGASPDTRMGDRHGTVVAYLVGRTWHDRKDYIQALLDAKADPNIPDDDGRTPLHLVALSSTGGAEEVMRLLIENKAQLEARDKNGMTPLHTAVDAWLSSNSPHLMLQLLEAGADTEARDNQGRTPLGIAISGRNTAFEKKSISVLFDGIAAKKREKEQALRNASDARQDALRQQRKNRPGLDLKK